MSGRLAPGAKSWAVEEDSDGEGDCSEVLLNSEADSEALLVDGQESHGKALLTLYVSF
jgi:hypothetical protein